MDGCMVRLWVMARHDDNAPRGRLTARWWDPATTGHIRSIKVADRRRLGSSRAWLLEAVLV